jgi:hypothetical protein
VPDCASAVNTPLEPVLITFFMPEENSGHIFVSMLTLSSNCWIQIRTIPHDKQNSNCYNIQENNTTIVGLPLYVLMFLTVFLCSACVSLYMGKNNQFRINDFPYKRGIVTSSDC